jgi:hypothetical protein
MYDNFVQQAISALKIIIISHNSHSADINLNVCAPPSVDQIKGGESESEER